MGNRGEINTQLLEIINYLKDEKITGEFSQALDDNFSIPDHEQIHKKAGYPAFFHPISFSNSTGGRACAK